MKKSKHFKSHDIPTIPSNSPFYGLKVWDMTPQELRDLKKEMRRFIKRINHKVLKHIPLTEVEQKYVDGKERIHSYRNSWVSPWHDSMPKLKI